MDPLPPTLQRAVERMYAHRDPMEFPDMITGSFNCFRFLLDRGLIRDTGNIHKIADVAYDGPRTCQYILTELGERHATTDFTPPPG